MKSFAAIAVASGLLCTAAYAETAEERQACMSDAFRVCGDAIPDRARVTACMVRNKSLLGPACRAVMARYSQPAVRNAADGADHAIKAERARAEAD